MAESGGVGEVLILDPAKSEVEPRAGDESRRWSGYLALDATRGTPGEKDGGGLTGGASPGDVMDTGWILIRTQRRKTKP